MWLFVFFTRFIGVADILLLLLLMAVSLVVLVLLLLLVVSGDFGGDVDVDVVGVAVGLVDRDSKEERQPRLVVGSAPIWE